MRFLFFLLLLTFTKIAAQRTYVSDSGDTHYCGPLTEAQLRGGDFADWFAADSTFTVPETPPAWAAELRDAEVKIFLGTWCGDSKTWVPRFVNYWRACGLDPEQLSFVALYNGKEKYKRGPNGEEAGHRIHRVPTFIFSRGGEEFSRIVEHPANDLETDLAQIALGFPSKTAYASADRLWELLETEPLDSLYGNAMPYLREIRNLPKALGGLYTLSNVFHYAGETERAKLVSYYNTRLNRFNPYVHKRHAGILMEAGDQEGAKKYYEVVLGILPEDEDALAALEKLRE